MEKVRCVIKQENLKIIGVHDLVRRFVLETLHNNISSCRCVLNCSRYSISLPVVLRSVPSTICIPLTTISNPIFHLYQRDALDSFPFFYLKKHGKFSQKLDRFLHHCNINIHWEVRTFQLIHCIAFSYLNSISAALV